MYIGYTKATPEFRFYQHCGWALKHGSNVPLANAIRKYGKDVWEVNTLKRCRSHKSALASEIAYIKKLNSYCNVKNHNGYNATLGGDGGKGVKLKTSRSKEWRENQAKILAKTKATHPNFYGPAHRASWSLSQMGEKNHNYGKLCYHYKDKSAFFVEGEQPKGWKLGRPDAHVLIGKDNPFHGKTHTKESRNKMSESLKGKRSGGLNPAARPVKIGSKKFTTKKAACSALKLTYKELTARLASKDYPKYSYA